MASDSFIGRTVGSYRILSKLGEGGMGAVYKAIHGKLDREVALKILPQSLIKGNPKYIERFFIEAKTAAKISNPNIVQVYDADQVSGLYYIAMEFVRGMDLKELLLKKSPLTEPEAIEFLLQAANGLAAASRQGIIHRDIKPANLMITTDGVLKIADFGLAKNTESSIDLTQPGHLIGTPAYMSPEQASGDKLDFRSDIYSLGICLFEMLTGVRPFIADTPIGLIKKHCLDPVPDIAQKLPDLDSSICALSTKMLAKKPEDRFQSYELLITEIERIQELLLSSQQLSSGAGHSSDSNANTLSDISGLVEESLCEQEKPDKTDVDTFKDPSNTAKASRSSPQTRKPKRTDYHRVRSNKNKAYIVLAIGGVALLGAIIALFAIPGESRKDAGQPPKNESNDVSQPDDSAAYRSAMDRGRRAEERNNFDAAKSAYEDALIAKPDDSDARDAIARVSVQMDGNADTSTLRKNLLERAKTALERRNLEEAERCFKEILVNSPGDSDSISGLAKIDNLRRELKRSESLKRCREAITIGDYDSAEAALKEAIAIRSDPETETIQISLSASRSKLEFNRLMEIGEKAEDAQDWQAARIAYEKAAQLNPEDERVRSALGRIYMIVDKQREEAFIQYLEKGKAAEKAGNFQDAVSFYKLALGVNPQDSEARVALDRVQSRLEGPASASTIKCPVCSGKKSIECCACTGTKRESGACPDCQGGKTEVCPKCKGSQKYKCQKCGGSGQARVWVPGRGMTTSKCSGCNGYGEVYCNKCKGKGVVNCDTCRGDGARLCPHCLQKGSVKCPYCDGLGSVQGGSSFSNISFLDLLKKDPGMTDVQRGEFWVNCNGKVIFWQAIVADVSSADGKYFLQLCMLPEDIQVTKDPGGIPRKHYKGRLLAVLQQGEAGKASSVSRGEKIWVSGTILGNSQDSFCLTDCRVFIPSAGK